MADCTEVGILDAVLAILVADELTKSPVFFLYEDCLPATVPNTQFPLLAVEFSKEGVTETAVGVNAQLDATLALDIYVMAMDADTQEARNKSINLAKLVKRALGRISNRKGTGHSWRGAGFRNPAIVPGKYEPEEGHRIRTAVVQWVCEYAENLEA